MNPEIQDDAHHAEFLGVDLVHKELGGSFLVFNLKSLDEELNASLELEIPQHWEHSIAQGSEFDPMTLPENKQEKQQALFRRNVANRKRDAWMQRLIFNEASVARFFGRDPRQLEIIVKPENMEEYVQNVNTMMNGVQCVMLRRGGDVWEILPNDDYPDDDPRFDGYRLAWRNQELGQ